MGGLLTSRFAQLFPSDVAGIALLGAVIRRLDVGPRGPEPHPSYRLLEPPTSPVCHAAATTEAVTGVEAASLREPLICLRSQHHEPRSTRYRAQHGPPGDLGYCAGAHVGLRNRPPRSRAATSRVTVLLPQRCFMVEDDHGRHVLPHRVRASRAGNLPGTLMADAVLDSEHPIRAMFVFANPLLSIACEQLAKAFEQRLARRGRHLPVDRRVRRRGFPDRTDMYEREDLTLSTSARAPAVRAVHPCSGRAARGASA